MSLQPEILELIHADIDGVADERALARLREAIASDPEVREEYRRLRGLADVLARVPMEEPSPRIAPAVLAAVRARRSRNAEGFWGRLTGRMPSGTAAVRYAYAVAAGVVLGVLGTHFAATQGLLGPTPADRGAAATLAPASTPGRLDLAPVGIPGMASVRPSTRGAFVALDLPWDRPAEFVLRFDPAKDPGKVEVLVVQSGVAAPAGSLTLPGKD